MNIVIVSPHPDDAELGCGGFIAKKTAEGHNVDILVINNTGDLTMRHSGEVLPFSKRMEEQHASAVELMASVTFLGRQSDGEITTEYHASKFNAVPLGETVKNLDNYFDSIFGGQVHLVIAPYASCNQDHDYVFKAVMASMRPVARPKVSFMCYEQTLDYFTSPEPTGYSTYTFLEEEHVLSKITALEKHVSQMQGRGEYNILSPEAVYTQARQRGFQCGVEFAECFKPIRVVL